jgi:hypothetical protein
VNKGLEEGLKQQSTCLAIVKPWVQTPVLIPDKSHSSKLEKNNKSVNYE